MKFSLLVKIESLGTSDFIKKEIAKHLATSDCSTCLTAPICPIKNNSIGVANWALAEGDTFIEIEKAINHFYSLSPTIILIDVDKDICYIYKGKGSLEDLKKNDLHKAMLLYDSMKHTVTFFESIQDLREIKKYYSINAQA